MLRFQDVKISTIQPHLSSQIFCRVEGCPRAEKQKFLPVCASCCTSAWTTYSGIFGSYGVMSTLAGLSNYRRWQKQNIQIASFEVKEKTRAHTKKTLELFLKLFASKSRQISSILTGSGCIVFCTPDLPSCLLEGVFCVSPTRGTSSRCGPRGSR